MSKQKIETHAFTIGGFSPFHKGHDEVVQQMKGAGHSSTNVFTTQSSRRPISAEKKVDYIKTAAGKGVNVDVAQTPFHAAAQLHKEGKRGKLVLYGGSDRAEIADRLREYNGKEGKHGYYKFDSIEFKKVGEERKEGAKGLAGFSGTAARKSKNPEELKKHLPKALHPRAEEIFKDMNESINPVGIFLIGGPGSGKDYVLKNIFSRFDLTEVQADQIINGVASELIESKQHIVINGANDVSKIKIIKSMLEGYTFDFVHVSVSNKVSRLRNELREEPISENKRIDKFLKAEELAKILDAFVFNNSINLNESSDMEKVFFAAQIERLLEKVVELGLELQNTTEIKTFVPLKEKVYMPAKYKTGNPKTDAARAAHWKKMSKYSDRNPKAYKDAPGDKKARKEGIPLSPHTVAVRKMMAKEETTVEPKLRRIPRSGNITAVMTARAETGRKIIAAEAAPRPNPPIEDVAKKHGVSVADLEKQITIGVKIEREHTFDEKEARRIAIDHLEEIPDYYTRLVDMEKSAKKSIDEAADSSLTAKAKKSGISVSTLRKVYRRGVAAWNSGHRPGTTPQQWGHARVNSYINKGKTYHTADKDLRNEEVDMDKLFEMQLDGTDSYRRHAIAMTPGQKQEIDDAYKSTKQTTKKETAVKQEEADCCGEQIGEGTPKNLRDFRKIRAEAKTSEENSAVDTTPKLQTGKETRRKVSKQTRNYNATMDGLPVVAGALAETKQVKGFMPTPRQVPAPPGGLPVPAGYERVKSWGGAWELRKIKEKPTTVKEAVEYHLENKISFTENIFRPGSDMFFEMISEAKRLHKEGNYTPADDFELDMLNSDIGEIAEYNGQTVVLDFPIEEGLEECWTGYVQKGMKKKGDKMVPNCVPVNEEVDQIDETMNTVYPHQYHGTIGPSDTGDHVYSFYVPEKGTSRRHTYSVSITNGPGKPGSKTGNLSFDYNGRKPKSFSPIKGDDVEYLRMHAGGDVGVTGKGGGKASSIISTVKAIAQKHAREHGLSNIEFGANWLEPSRTKLYDRITSRLGGKNMGMEDDDSPYVKYSVPVKEGSDPTDGKGIGKPWREGGGGAVYVRDGGSIRKIRFSQSGMKKKYMDPGATRSFVARHRCLTNKDKTSASYWACRWPRFFSNSGKTWW